MGGGGWGVRGAWGMGCYVPLVLLLGAPPFPAPARGTCSGASATLLEASWARAPT
jgi:hypothetical protein